jgi:hypothetical protein
MKKLFTVLASIAGLASGAGPVLAKIRVNLITGNDARGVAVSCLSALLVRLGCIPRDPASERNSLGYPLMWGPS